MSLNELLEKLEDILYDSRIEKTWENVEKLIKETKEKIEKQQKESMGLMAFMLKFDPKTQGFMAPFPAPSVMEKVEELDKSETEGIHCILEDKNINPEKCKICFNQCVKYKEYLNI